MKPGRELDALIAEKVFGLRPVMGGPYSYSAHDEKTGNALPLFSTDIAAAWEVFEWLCKQPYGENSAIVRLSDGRYYVFPMCGWIGGPIDEANPNYEDGKLYGPFGDTAPHAICLAALETVLPAVYSP